MRLARKVLKDGTCVQYMYQDVCWSTWNPGGPAIDENTASEEAHVRVSEDGGKTWGTPVVIDAGEGNLGVSHGVFLSHDGRLRAFMGSFYDRFQKTHTRAYVLDEATGEWKPEGVVVENGFWPHLDTREPVKSPDDHQQAVCRHALDGPAFPGMHHHGRQLRGMRQTNLPRHLATPEAKLMARLAR